MFGDNKMISRMGKFTNSKHIILKKIDQMGEGKERKFIVKPTRSVLPKEVSLDHARMRKHAS